MKTKTCLLALAAVMISVGLQGGGAWASRALGATVSGEITSSPSPTQIEVAHHVYRIKAGSPAAASARNFALGQVVDITLDRPAVDGQPQVVSIAPHAR